MEWRVTLLVTFFDDFEAEFDMYPAAVQDAVLVKAGLLEREGPRLSRPHADTLKGSKYANMKELRCEADRGVWRVLFAFDPDRHLETMKGKKDGNDTEGKNVATRARPSQADRGGN